MPLISLSQVEQLQTNELEQQQKYRTATSQLQQRINQLSDELSTAVVALESEKRNVDSLNRTVRFVLHLSVVDCDTSGSDIRLGAQARESIASQRATNHVTATAAYRCLRPLALFIFLSL